MSADDFLLFIDANEYLDFYRRDKSKSLLALLGEQVNYIFVTQQVVNEVQRNKVLVAADFLTKKHKVTLQTFNLPDHLSSTNIDQPKDILNQMKSIGQEVTKVNGKANAFVLTIMEQISRSQDEASKALSPIFANAIPHSRQELQRARNRRELGNPPGKIAKSIDDQLTWEQILTHFKGKKRLWIISRDGDYGTVYGDKHFLNSFLYDELCRVASAEPEVYLFGELNKGITHFVNTTKVKAENRLKPEEVKEIEKEEKSFYVKPGLPPYFCDDLDLDRDSWMKATVCPSCKAVAVFPQLYSTGYRYVCANCKSASPFFPADDPFL